MRFGLDFLSFFKRRSMLSLIFHAFVALWRKLRSFYALLWTRCPFRSGGLSILLFFKQLTLSLFTFSSNLSFFQLGKFTFSSETLLISCWNLLISWDTEIVNSSGTLLVFMLLGSRILLRCFTSHEGSSATGFWLVEPFHCLSCNSICKISDYCFCLS